jgi:hypothetical protein
VRLTCESAQELIDAGALGALDRDDARALEGHLASCAECTLLARHAGDTAAAFAMAVPLVASSAALKSRIMASAAVLTDIRRAKRSRIWPGAVAALFVLGIGALSWGAFTQMQVNDLEGTNATIARGATAQAGELATMRQQLVAASASTESLKDDVAAQDAVLNVVSLPDAEHTSLKATSAAPGATARCIWSKAQSIGAFIAENLPLPPAGAAYQVWVIYENAWSNAGTLAVAADGKGRLIMNKLADPTADAGAFLGFAVTLEADPKSATHSGRVVLTSLN